MIGERLCFALTYLAEAMMAWLYFKRLFSSKYGWPSVIGGIILGHGILFALSGLDNLGINASAFFFINFLILLIFYTSGIKAALLHSAFMSFVMIGAEIIISMLLGYIVNDYSAYTYNFTVLVTLGVCSKLLYFLVIMLSSGIFSSKYDDRADPHFLLLLCAMPVASMLTAASIVFVCMNSALPGWLELFMVCCVMAMLAANILVLMIYDGVKRINSENIALQLSAVRDAANLEYYSMLSEQYDNQRILIHDFNNHINVLDALIEEGNTEKAKSYISMLSDLPELKKKLRLCREPILNMILLRFSEQCKEKGIYFDCNIRSECFDFIDTTDITSLFGNLLSNAFEAAEISDEKCIELSVSLSNAGHSLLISLENSCDEAPLTSKSGNYISRKQDKYNHGLGMKSIERVVNKYEGMIKCYFIPEKKSFHCVINLPVR